MSYGYSDKSFGGKQKKMLAASRRTRKREEREVVAAVRRDLAVGGVVRNPYNNDMYAARKRRAARNEDNHAVDVTAGAISIANCFSSAGSVAATPFVPVTGSSAWCLNQVATGDSSTTRHGKRITLTGLAIRAHIFSGTTGTTANARLVLVWDRAPNGGATIPAFASVFTEQNGVALTLLDNAPRFKILRNWLWSVNGDQDGGSQTSNTSFIVDEFVKFKNKVTLFKSGSTTAPNLADMIEGSLLLYAMGSQVAGTAAPSMQIMMRLYFKDA